MNLTEAEDNRTKDLLPLQRNVRVDNLTFLNEILRFGKRLQMASFTEGIRILVDNLLTLSTLV